MVRTLLIGFDGGTFTILDSLLEEGIMPALKSLIENGVRAELLSTPNPLTPPAWISVMTGHSPGHHGVFDFIRVVEHENGCYFALVNALDVRCETIWSIASRNGLSATCLNFIAMNPPRPIKGHIVPGYITSRTLKLNVYPPEIYSELKALPGFSVNDITWDLDQGRKPVLYQLEEDEYEGSIRYHIKRERQWFNVLRHLMITAPCELTAIIFDGVDKLQHLFWRFLDLQFFPENPSPWEVHIRKLCLDYFRELDGFLAELVQIAGEKAQIFIVSDHGFGPSHEIFYANGWLNEHGYLKWKEGTAQDHSYNLTAKHLRDHFESIDWDQTKAYAPTSSINGIYIRVARKAGQPGVPPSDYGAFRARLMSALLEYRTPDTGEQIIAKILTREEAFPGPYMDQAPDLTLVFRDGACVSILNAPYVVKRRSHVFGAHRPQGIFIAAGSGIRRGMTLSPLSILHVAPTVLYSCGLPVPENFEAEIAVEAFAPAFLRSRPVERMVPLLPIEPIPEMRQEVKLTETEEAQVLERLKGLGYLD